MTGTTLRALSVLLLLPAAAACGRTMEETVEVVAEVNIDGRPVRFTRHFTCRLEAKGNQLAPPKRQQVNQFPGRVVAKRLTGNEGIVLPLGSVCRALLNRYEGRRVREHRQIGRTVPVLWLDDAKTPSRVELYQARHGPPSRARVRVVSIEVRSLPQMVAPSDPAEQVPWLDQATDRTIFFRARGVTKPCWLRHDYLPGVLQDLDRSQVIPFRRGTFNIYDNLRAHCRREEEMLIEAVADPDRKELHLTIGRTGPGLPLVPQRDLPEYRFLRDYSVWINGRRVLERYAPTFYDAEREMVIQVTSFVFDQSDLKAGRRLPWPGDPFPP